MSRAIRVVVVYPREVEPACNQLPSILKELNEGMAADRQIRFEPPRQWKTDVAPGSHVKGPQALIDSELKPCDCDILVGILWKTLGAGTVHEINLGLECYRKTGKPRVMVYFCERKAEIRGDSELHKVQAFRRHLSKEVLWGLYKNESEFERLVRNHLMLYLRGEYPIRQYEIKQLAAKAIRSRWGRERLNECERELALELYDDLRDEVLTALRNKADGLMQIEALRLVVRCKYDEDLKIALRNSDKWAVDPPEL